MDTLLTLGVVIGRFQVPDLHEGHRYLIDTALRRSDAVLILIGSRKGFPTERNPLPYRVREAMLRDAYPDAVIRELPDHPSNESWSETVDRLIAETAPDAEAMFYGSRDSFISSYSGKHPIIVIPQLGRHSGTELRNEAGKTIRASTDFRTGLIHAQHIREPISYQTVDIAVVRHGDQAVLLGKKSVSEGLWLIGGFVDPKDRSLEQAALRELSEEAGRLNTHELHYLGSYRMNDFRYRGESDLIMTALFAAYHLSGNPCAHDDIEAVEWVPFRKLVDRVDPEHRILAERVVQFIENGR
jgi:bifunctional NMN adenylyltransferase/nudix hydrolase